MYDCFACSVISKIKNGNYPFFVFELKESYVVLSESQRYKGYCFLLYKNHEENLESLGIDVQLRLWNEVAVVAKNVKKIFNPDRINIESLANKVNHVHFHVIPRYLEWDPEPKEPIWVRPFFERQHAALSQEISEMVSKLNAMLEADFYSLANYRRSFLAPGYNSAPMNFQIANKLYAEINASSLFNDKEDVFMKSFKYNKLYIEGHLNPNNINHKEKEDTLNDFIESCDKMSQNQVKIGEDCEWRKNLGSDIENIREFALFLHSIISLVKVFKSEV